MKLQKYIFVLFAVLLAVSCSKDDDVFFQSSQGEEEKNFTFSAAIDYGMREAGEDRGLTRAVSATKDEAPTRCCMQAFSGGTAVTDVLTGTKNGNAYTFSVRLIPDTEYTCLFWADNDADASTPASLTNVSYTAGNVAFAAVVSGTPEAISTAVTLKHVVTKLTLQTTAAATIAEDAPLSIRTRCATTYNVLTSSADGATDCTVVQNISGSFAANENITSFYILPAGSKEDVILDCHNSTQTITAVPFSANTHITLKGDLSGDNGDKTETNNE